MNQGKAANKSGNKLKKFVCDILLSKGYIELPKEKFRPGIYLEQPIFSKGYIIKPNIYEGETHCDFIIFHPEKHSKCLIIECKWQQKAGSVDEKFPYIVENIKNHYPHNAILILDGGGYKRSAEKWVKAQVNAKFISVFNMSEFQKWANDGKL